MNRLLKFNRIAIVSVLSLSLSGCERVPSFNLLGSYFPSWIACFLAGVIVTIAAHQLFVRLNFARQMWPLPIVYAAFICLATCSSWLVFFS
jgi:YtcA family